jgi:hypothetical protein
MPAFNLTTLLASGSTTNQTSASKPVAPDTDAVAFRIICEAIGATPAITWLIQGAMDDIGVSDANSFFEPIGYADSKVNDTNIVFAALAGPVIAGTQQTIFSSLIRTRPYRKYRAVISGVVNVTYRIEMFTTDAD